MTSFSDQLQEALGTGYELERELLGGGMSRVFVAKDRSLGRTIVVKVLPPDLAAGVNRERFRREIQLAAQLQHPHIVQLLSAGESGDLLWYTMPYIDGESLRAAIERKKPFSVKEVTRIMHDVVDALAYAHKRGVVHRDIKPANILTQGSHALVTDFGVAKALSAALPGAGVGFTTAGMAIGTPSYMAPEQLAGDPDADHRIDLYAAGLLAYELLSGQSPFAGPSPRETMAAQLTRDPQPLHEVNPAVPAAMSALVMRLLAKDPDDRPPSAEAVLEELDGMTMTIGPSTPVSGGVAGVMAPAARNLTRVFAAVGVLAVLLIIAALVLKPGEQLRAQRRAQAEARRDSVQRATDSLTKIAQAASAPVVLSHEDSLKIADNVNRAMRAARVRDSVARAKLRDSIQRVEERRARDSIFRAFGGARPSVTKRRIVVVEPMPSSRWPEAERIGRAVADSLRAMLAKRAFIIVSPDSVRALRVQVRDVNGLASALSSDLLVSIQIQERPPRRGAAGIDSVQLRVNAYDLTAQPRYYSRSLPASSLWGPREEILGSLEATLLQTIGALEEMTRAPRRTPGDPLPGTTSQQTITLPDGRVIHVPGVPRGSFEVRTTPPKKPPVD
ncbi:MAG TPA: serine/threonine-protein kinase [Gemmatimonadaceae bacterium]|nr:serine/threonine-protein kinase [Gemmatimonadaceae bacterium]